MVHWGGGWRCEKKKKRRPKPQSDKSPAAPCFADGFFLSFWLGGERKSEEKGKGTESVWCVWREGNETKKRQKEKSTPASQPPRTAAKSHRTPEVAAGDKNTHTYVGAVIFHFAPPASPTKSLYGPMKDNYQDEWRHTKQHAPAREVEKNETKGNETKRKTAMKTIDATRTRGQGDLGHLSKNHQAVSPATPQPSSSGSPRGRV